MRCPICERKTFAPVRINGVKQRPANAPEGSVTAALNDGTCFTCRRIETGARKRKRETVHRHQMTETELLQATRDSLNFLYRRRARGVPHEGLNTASLARPGLFLMEVP